jgi:type IV pilus assembly protein PilZ
MTEQHRQSFVERRSHHRHPVRLDVNYRRGETYLFSRAENLSELGIFIVSDEPFDKTTELDLRFLPPEGGEAIEITGEVVWVERGTAGRQPGMGVRFINPTPQLRQRIQALIRTVAYLE